MLLSYGPVSLLRRLAVYRPDLSRRRGPCQRDVLADQFWALAISPWCLAATTQRPPDGLNPRVPSWDSPRRCARWEHGRPRLESFPNYQSVSVWMFHVRPGNAGQHRSVRGPPRKRWSSHELASPRAHRPTRRTQTEPATVAGSCRRRMLVTVTDLERTDEESHDVSRVVDVYYLLMSSSSWPSASLVKVAPGPSGGR